MWLSSILAKHCVSLFLYLPPSLSLFFFLSFFFIFYLFLQFIKFFFRGGRGEGCSTKQLLSHSHTLSLLLLSSSSSSGGVATVQHVQYVLGYAQAAVQKRQSHHTPVLV